MISDPLIRVECDKCGYSEEYGMTPLVRKSWDLRDLNKEIIRSGWKLDDENDIHICESCQSEEETL